MRLILPIVFWGGIAMLAIPLWVLALTGGGIGGIWYFTRK